MKKGAAAGVVVACVRALPGRRMLLAGVLALAPLVLASRPAAAYPQFQFTSGTQRCAQCHFSPAGFGLITNWGRDEAADTISTTGGDGGFLHGAVSLPESVALGGDLRGAILYNDSGGDGMPELKVFPMQAELYGRVAFGETGLSLYVAGGVRGATREKSDSLATGHFESFISREHYLMWKPSGTGPYVRAGRFYAPFGLRLAEHIYFVRQYTGFNLYEETYNLSGGYLAEKWDVHATAFTPPPDSLPTPLRSTGPRSSGGAVYGELRLDDRAALGAQVRFSTGSEQSLTQAGLIGKLWVEPARMLVMAEADFHRMAIVGGESLNQLVAYAGVTFIPYKGIMAGIAADRYQEDLRVSTTARNAFNLQINLFPRSHWELLILGRYQPAASSGGSAATLGLLQLHYYL
jgi:hypothetical protein